jgi:hypothetical protein
MYSSIIKRFSRYLSLLFPHCLSFLFCVVSFICLHSVCLWFSFCDLSLMFVGSGPILCVSWHSLMWSFEGKVIITFSNLYQINVKENQRPKQEKNSTSRPQLKICVFARTRPTRKNKPDPNIFLAKKIATFFLYFRCHMVF